MAKIGMGIDAGGTYTDAVIYSFEQNQVLASAKALTTKEDYCIGIRNALDALPQDLLQQTEYIALSTTLATNACVENKGCRGKLLFVGVDQLVVNWVGDAYGLPPLEEIRILDKPDHAGDLTYPLEKWTLFLQENQEWFYDADGIAVVDIDAGSNSAVFEKDLREKIRGQYDIPVICGYELSSELNSIRRGASTLLNVRLIPIISAFLEAVRTILQEKNLHVPVSIVRSDGTLMSDTITRERPVETLLCGPASGLIGGAYMTGEQDCLIVDMGGTTTDISIVQDGVPLSAKDGIQIGKWRTFVKGAFVDTFGLGGDSIIRVDKYRNIVLGTERAVPLCMAAQRYPSIANQLIALHRVHKGHSLPLHEFLILLKEQNGQKRYSEQEEKLCAALSEGPLSLRSAAEAWGTDLYNFNPERLLREGVIIRCGLTPTDIMHLSGSFTQYETEAARYGALFLASSAHMPLKTLVDRINDMVKNKLYRNIVRILLQNKYPALRKTGIDPQLMMIIDKSWEEAQAGHPQSLLANLFHTPITLVGIGAPTYIYLPDVAKVLGTKCIVPENAGVANALGAIVSRIESSHRVEVRALQSHVGMGGYQVQGPYEQFYTLDKEAALENAMQQCKKAAYEEARRRGLAGELDIQTDWDHEYFETIYGSIYFRSWAIVHVRGSAMCNA